MVAKSKSNKPSLFKLIGFVLLCQLAGILGSIFTVSAIPTWYVFLQKPTLTPPSWVFGPVWTTLYTFMGIALYWIYLKGNTDKIKNAIRLFMVHLAANAIWSIIFFGYKNLLAALIVLIGLDVMVFVIIYKFYKLDKRAGVILIPYLAWCLFASYLNLSIFLLN